jgi:integrase
MSLYPRKNSPYLWCKFTVNGELVQQSTRVVTKKEAKEFEAKLRVELLAKAEQEEKPVHFWEDAVVKYYTERLIEKPSSPDRSDLKWLHQHLSGVDITKLNRAFLADIGDIKLSTGVKPSTVNRMMKLVRAVLHQAVIWEWIDQAPKVKMFPAAQVNLRFITREEADRLVAALPPYLCVLAEFSFQTGLRMSNATHLKWSQVNLEKKQAWINAAEAKMRRSIPVPLSEVAIKLIESQMGKHEEYVFVHNGKPIKKTSCKAWYATKKAVGIENFRWHDIRKTWASWHVQNGTSLLELKELGGWTDINSVLIYAHLGSQHLAKIVNLPIGKATLTATQAIPEMAEAA